jgi:hypothetical protein
MATATKPAHTNGRASSATPRTEGWYPDPKTHPGQRYWDGKDWTEHVSPPGLTFKICCVLGALAVVGLCIAAVMKAVIDGKHVTVAGYIGATSAGVLFAALAVAWVVNFYRGKMLKAEAELGREKAASV